MNLHNTTQKYSVYIRNALEEYIRTRKENRNTQRPNECIAQYEAALIALRKAGLKA